MARARERASAAWGRLEAEAPHVGEVGRARLERTGLALLGTLRRDGSPRVSPVEPYLAGGSLLFGAMAWSAKAQDLVRDPRCVLHSAVTGPDAGEPELKLYGAARELVDEALREADGRGWWIGRPARDARVFEHRIARAVLVEWDLERGVVQLTRWTPGRPPSRTTRAYP